MNGLNLVDLTTEEGDINVRDVFATDIRLVAQGGNVVSEGILEGSVYVDIANDGDFVAKYVEGPSLMASTELGNINVMGDCHSEMSQFRTAVGNINLRHLFGHSYILVKRSGTVVLHLIEGSVNVSMQTGGAFTILENIVSDSSIQVSIDPLSQPTITAGSDHYFTNVVQNLAKQNKFLFKLMVATSGIVSLAEGIIIVIQLQLW